MNDRQDELLSSFLPHEVTTTQDLLQCLSGPPTADSFRRMLLLFLRGHYSSATNYMGFDHLSCFTWNPDVKLSKLAVEFTHNADDRKADNYPGIFIGFAESNFNKVAVGDYAGHTQDLAGTHVAKEAVADYEIFHVAKNASDAYDLAEMTARVLLAMGPVMARNGRANGFEVIGMRRPVEKKPAPKSHYTVAIPIKITYTLAVTRTLESHRIRRISQILTAEK
jgi:hypothetical protein